MLRRFSFRRAVHYLAAALLTLPACSGSDDIAGPGDPGPQLPDFTFAGHYLLSSIGEGRPGQVIRIANPDGSVVGLYRFLYGTLDLNPSGGYSVYLEYEDETRTYVLEDEGQYTWHSVDGGVWLDLSSDTYDDDFDGAATREGAAAIDYDLDGSGEAETRFGFQLGTEGWKWVGNLVSERGRLASGAR